MQKEVEMKKKVVKSCVENCWNFFLIVAVIEYFSQSKCLVEKPRIYTNSRWWDAAIKVARKVCGNVDMMMYEHHAQKRRPRVMIREVIFSKTLWRQSVLSSSMKLVVVLVFSFTQYYSSGRFCPWVFVCWMLFLWLLQLLKILGWKVVAPSNKFVSTYL